MNAGVAQADGNLNLAALENLARFNGTDVTTLMQYMSTGVIPHQDSIYSANPNKEPERSTSDSDWMKVSASGGGPGGFPGGGMKQEPKIKTEPATEPTTGGGTASDPLAAERARVQHMQDSLAMQFQQYRTAMVNLAGTQTPGAVNPTSMGYAGPESHPLGSGGKGGTPWITGTSGQTTPNSDSDTVTLPKAQYDALVSKGKPATHGRSAPWPPTGSKSGYRFYVPNQGVAKAEGIYGGAGCMEANFKPGTTWENVGKYAVAAFATADEAHAHFFRNFPNHTISPMHR